MPKNVNYLHCFTDWQKIENKYLIFSWLNNSYEHYDKEKLMLRSAWSLDLQAQTMWSIIWYTWWEICSQYAPKTNNCYIRKNEQFSNETMLLNLSTNLTGSLLGIVIVPLYLHHDLCNLDLLHMIKYNTFISIQLRFQFYRMVWLV